MKNSNQQDTKGASVSQDGLSAPVLSVVIPHLNGPEALSQCLAALAAEVARLASDVAVIVVDNGSSRRPEEVCAAYPFVQLIDEPTPGPGPARSRGARLVETEIIAFVDADCTVAPGWITAILNHFRDHPKTSVIGGDVRIACADVARPTAIEAYESVFGYRFKLYVERDHYTGTGNMAVRREVFHTVGDFAGIHTAEDVDWGRRATAMGFRIDYVPDMVIETPARITFAELARKWDRHIGHGYDGVTSFVAQGRWVLRALAIGVSPLVEIPRVLQSNRLSGLRARWLALVCLTRIRFYRCGRMLGTVVGLGPSSEAVWRRDG